MKTFLTTTLLFILSLTSNAQSLLDIATIEDIVKNDRAYFNDIVELYRNDDPYLDVNDVAMVYYGQVFLPEFKAGSDENERLLKEYSAEGNYAAAYNTALKIMEYNPVSLNALFNLLISSKQLNKSEEEYKSYATKYMAILNMITTYGNGRSGESAFKLITPDDQDYILYGKLGIKKVLSHELDTESLCNIVIVEPTPQVQTRRIYFDLKLYLSSTAK